MPKDTEQLSTPIAGSSSSLQNKSVTVFTPGEKVIINYLKGDFVR